MSRSFIAKPDKWIQVIDLDGWQIAVSKCEDTDNEDNPYQLKMECQFGGGGSFAISAGYSTKKKRNAEFATPMKAATSFKEYVQKQWSDLKVEKDKR